MYAASRQHSAARIRSTPGAPWNGFTAEEFVDATESEFCWEARMGSNFVTSVSVTDAYEHGHGRVVLEKGRSS